MKEYDREPRGRLGELIAGLATRAGRVATSMGVGVK